MGPERFALTPRCALVLEQGDLTRARVDAIVNAANERLLGGGGVDGAIHRAAGPELLTACRAIAEVRAGVRCPTGEARITPGFGLAARFVIHTVGPVYRSAEASAPLLERAHRASLALANERGLASVAFPAISCGVYGYPLDEAAPIALAACRAGAGGLEEVRFVLFGADAFEAWRRAAARIG
jgi:O-acetyl-ADP-ribose deacetylase (regulator of RNase III)